MSGLSNSVLRRLSATQNTAGDHVDPDLLAAFSEGCLKGSERENVVAHLAACPDCRSTLALAASGVAEGELQPVAAEMPGWKRVFGWQSLVAAAGIACLAVVSLVMLNLRPSGAKQMASATPSQSRTVQAPPPSSPAGADAITLTAPAAAPEQRLPVAPQMKITNGTAGKLESNSKFGRSSDSSLKATPKVLRSDDKVAGTGSGGAFAPPKVVSPAPPPPAPPVASAEVVNDGRVGNDRQQNTPAQQPAANSAPQQNTGAADQGKNQTAANNRYDSWMGDQKVAEQKTAGGNVSVSQSVTQSPGAAGTAQTVQSQPEDRGLRGRAEPSRAEQKTTTDDTFESTNGNATAPRSGNAAEAAAKSAARKTAAMVAKTKTPAAKVLAGVRWSISTAGALQRSRDEGRTWETVSVGASVTFRAADASPESVWAGGEAAALYRSLDGEHWNRIVPAAGERSLNGAVIEIKTTDSHVTVRTSTGQTWLSIDGGQHWQLQ
jgi:hypothetical protein